MIFLVTADPLRHEIAAKVTMDATTEIRAEEDKRNNMETQVGTPPVPDTEATPVEVATHTVEKELGLDPPAEAAPEPTREEALEPTQAEALNPVEPELLEPVPDTGQKLSPQRRRSKCRNPGQSHKTKRKQNRPHPVLSPRGG